MKFWETKPELWDEINNVGLRNHYFCTVYAGILLYSNIFIINLSLKFTGSNQARLMVPRKQGLIVNISSFGGARYLFNVAYGIGKVYLILQFYVQAIYALYFLDPSMRIFAKTQAACDRMAVDCGIELKKHNVTMLSLYPGAVKTELCMELSKKPLPEAAVGNKVLK